MVRLSDLHEVEQEHMRLRISEWKPVEKAPWITPKPLKEARVAIISTAGLHRRTDTPFVFGAVDYRLIPGDVDFKDVVVSHVSANFDRTGFQQTQTFGSPDRLREMQSSGEIVGVWAKWHYSFMGAQPNHVALQAAGEEVGRLLAADEVDIALDTCLTCLYWCRWRLGKLY